jgi:hypothetical protein
MIGRTSLGGKAVLRVIAFTCCAVAVANTQPVTVVVHTVRNTTQALLKLRSIVISTALLGRPIVVTIVTYAAIASTVAIAPIVAISPVIW